MKIERFLCAVVLTAVLSMPALAGYIPTGRTDDPQPTPTPTATTTDPTSNPTTASTQTATGADPALPALSEIVLTFIQTTLTLF